MGKKKIIAEEDIFQAIAQIKEEHLINSKQALREIIDFYEITENIGYEVILSSNNEKIINQAKDVEHNKVVELITKSRENLEKISNHLCYFLIVISTSKAAKGIRLPMSIIYALSDNECLRFDQLMCNLRDAMKHNGKSV